MLLADNLGACCSIDETSLCNEVYTIVFNKAGHGKKGSVIAIVKRTKANVVSAVLKKISKSKREKVTEISMDFGDSMFSIAKQCFLKTTIVNIVQRLCEGLEEMRLRFKRLAVTESRKEAAAFAQDEDRKAKQRAYYRKKHPRNKKERRGRKRIRKQKYKPTLLTNDETKVEMLTRSRNMLAQSGDKWGDSKKERARILFGQYPQMKEAYSLICKVRATFKSHIIRKEAKEKLHEWYKEVNACTLREIKAARNAIKGRIRLELFSEQIDQCCSRISEL